jgi:hypothetical protein
MCSRREHVAPYLLWRVEEGEDAPCRPSESPQSGERRASTGLAELGTLGKKNHQTGWGQPVSSDLPQNTGIDKPANMGYNVTGAGMQ